MKHYGDITKLSGYDLPIVDVITGGSPCQDLSVAGKRAGLDGERSGLFMEQVRIVKEMREHDRQIRSEGADGHIRHIRPRFMVWENVPGAFSSNGGKDFQAVLTEIVRIAEPEAPDVPMPAKRWDKAGCLYDELGKWSVAWRVHDAQFWGVPQRRKRIALVADFGGLCAPEILFERRGLCRNYPPQREARKEAPETVRGGAPRTITQSVSKNEQENPGGKGILIQDERVGALSTLNNQSVFCIEGHVVDRETAQNGIGVKENISQTLNATDRHAIFAAGFDGSMGASENVIVSKPCNETHQTVVGTIDCGIAKGTGNQLTKQDMFVTSCRTVRRLTPLECERLQGFPDGWTDIGEWIDTKGKKHKPADSPRYKALGNSIALPFWFYILRRIAAQYERPATLGSLFDGIGGFPLCWERCNGPGTAVLASEIEEFPIAVTKRHFPEPGERVRRRYD